MSSRLSVIMPVWNGEAFLSEAIATVRRSAAPIELIVIDDGSTDSTASVAQNLGDSVIYIRQPNSGPAVARNRGLQEATGDFIGFLDADDLWTDAHPDAALSYLAQHPDIDLVMGRIQLFVRSAGPGAAFVPSGSPFHTCLLGATIVRRRLIEKIGGFNPDMRYGEDVDWFLRARESGAGIANLPGVALYYRRHRLDAVARDIVSQKSRTGLLDAFHRSLQRKRSVSPPAQGRPLVSVVIPVFNGEPFIAAAIESVLAQDYRPLEVIVADDGSTDRTREIVATFPLVSLLALEHRSAGAARNAGVRAAKGQVIAFLDADDLWLPEKISRQMEALIADPALEAVFAHLQEFREEGAEAKDRSRPGLTPATMLIRRAAFTRIGWFSEEESALEGVDWQLRASEESLRTLMLPDVLYRRRIHGKNRSIVDRDLNGYIRALKASLDRRRRSADVTPHAEGS